MKMVDCQGLGGHGIILGGVQAGFELVHRVALPGGFGNTIVAANAGLLGDSFDPDMMETGNEHEWTPQKWVSYVAGVPPCSGFSLMNTSAAAAKARGKDAPANARGADSNINLCQAALVQYASRTTGSDGKTGPEFVVFESVQGAFSQGMELMRTYWQRLKSATEQPYELAHVKMSVASIGGAQYRHRYFWVAHRVPFGIDRPLITRMTTVGDVISDLVNGGLQWEPQPYPEIPFTEQQVELRGNSGGLVDHIPDTKQFAFVEDLMPFWDPGKAIHTAARTMVDAGYDLPERLDRRWIPETRLFKGFMYPFRVAADEPSPVLTGACASNLIHPTEDRFLTVRELSRVMGIPDEWTFDGTARHPMNAGMWIGKNCTTGAGKWLADSVMAALDGRVEDRKSEAWHNESYKKIPLGDGERVFDITLDYKQADNFERRKR